MKTGFKINRRNLILTLRLVLVIAESLAVWLQRSCFTSLRLTRLTML